MRSLVAKNHLYRAMFRRGADKDAARQPAPSRRKRTRRRPLPRPGSGRDTPAAPCAPDTPARRRSGLPRQVLQLRDHVPEVFAASRNGHQLHRLARRASASRSWRRRSSAARRSVSDDERPIAVNESTTLSICAFTRASSAAAAVLSGCWPFRIFACIRFVSSRRTPGRLRGLRLAHVAETTLYVVIARRTRCAATRRGIRFIQHLGGALGSAAPCRALSCRGGVCSTSHAIASACSLFAYRVKISSTTAACSAWMIWRCSYRPARSCMIKTQTSEPLPCRQQKNVTLGFRSI